MNIRALILSALLLPATLQAMDGEDYVRSMVVFQDGGPYAVREYLLNLSMNGDDDAMYQLGQLMVSAGYYREAFDLFEAGAITGNNKAVFALGMMAANGKTPFFNPQKAYADIRKASDSGLTEATYQLALFTMDGFGIAPNASRAKALMKKAAKAGFREAKKKLEEKKWRHR